MHEASWSPDRILSDTIWTSSDRRNRTALKQLSSPGWQGWTGQGEEDWLKVEAISSAAEDRIGSDLHDPGARKEERSNGVSRM